MTYHEEKLLILTKTYPAPSKKLRETSCVAAINQDGQMRRLFPIPFRLLDGDQQFHRWEWINARVIKAKDDHRKESYKVDVDSIKRLQQVGTNHGWAERLQWIAPHFLPDFASLEDRRQASGETLGFIRPIKYRLTIEAADEQDWTDEEKAKLVQDGLFDESVVRNRVSLKKIPNNFYYEYECHLNVEKHFWKHKLTDWEVGALYWKCIKLYGQEWEKYFRQKLETDFLEKRELAFLMGTMHRFPDQWLIVGLVYPPRKAARQQAFQLPPGG